MLRVQRFAEGTLRAHQHDHMPGSVSSDAYRRYLQLIRFATAT